MVKMFKSLALLACVTFALLGCTSQQTSDAIDIGVSGMITNNAIEQAQADLGSYSENQETLRDLDRLQEDLINTITKGEGVLDIPEYYTRALQIYVVLADEVDRRQDELTPDQLMQLKLLNFKVLDLDRKVNAFMEQEDNRDYFLIAGNVYDVVNSTKSILLLMGLL